MNATSWWALAFSFSLLPPVAAAGAEEPCRACHAGIADAYLKTGMGRSIQERPAPFSAEFYHRLSNRYYSFDGGRLTRHQLDAAGRRINIVEKTVDLAIGSGNHAITYTSRGPGGRLLELPVSWYRAVDGYRMSPGYDRADHPGMRREINDACLFCHSDGPSPAPITCRRCHGDTAAHLARPRRGTIHNPGQSMEVCLQCHLETASSGIVDSMLQPGRERFSYRPGEPLASYKLYFDRAEGPPRFEVNHAGYRLMKSACFQKSAGKLGCVTCHDPHSARVRENSCAGCHAVSAHTRENPDCAACHMPKRATQDAVHVTMTDHWIQRTPLRLEPPTETTEAIPFYTPADPLAIAVANVQAPSEESARVLIRHLRRAPRDTAALVALGKMLQELGRAPEAERHLRQAIALDPQNSAAHTALGAALARQGKLGAAAAQLERATLINPDDSFAWLNLGITRRELKQPVPAAAAFREAIRLQPDLGAARLGLASVGSRP